MPADQNRGPNDRDSLRENIAGLESRRAGSSLAMQIPEAAKGRRRFFAV
jgi:hypothetical protein